jgi:hypothetical protein
MAWHNLNDLQNVTSVVSMTDYIAKTTNGMFFQLLLVIMFVVMLMALIRTGFQSAVMTSAFLCWILSIYLVYLGYVNFIYSIIFFVIAIMMLFYMYVTKQ